MVTAIVAAGLAAVFLITANGTIARTGTGSTGYALVGAAAILAGFLAGSYVSTPIGAAATLCDLRWPVLGSLRRGVGELGEGGAAVGPDRRRPAFPSCDGIGPARLPGAGAQGHVGPQRIAGFRRRRLHRLPPTIPPPVLGRRAEAAAAPALFLQADVGPAVPLTFDEACDGRRN